MAKTRKTRLKLITFIYCLLLVYIVAALVWWFVTLEKQNGEMTTLKYANLEAQKTTLSPAQYDAELNLIKKENTRNTGKYIAEGITFLLLTLLGAAFVYRSVLRQFRLQQQQQNFMMAVTHELKTPISVATLNLETLQKYNLEPEKQKKIIQTALKETSRLNALTNNILISSQIEGGGYVSSKEELDLSDLFRDCVLDFKTRYPERKFVDEIETEVVQVGDLLLLQLMINNLLENAIKYSTKEQNITCRLTRKGRERVLEIIDEGMGIPDDEKKKIFGKFYRIGNELTRKTQGTGLGLYLCSKIAADHNADITVTNHTPSGSNFAITFHG